MVSGDRTCNVDSELAIDDPSYLSHCNVVSLDMNTCRTINDLHVCVETAETAAHENNKEVDTGAFYPSSGPSQGGKAPTPA